MQINIIDVIIRNAFVTTTCKNHILATTTYYSKIIMTALPPRANGLFPALGWVVFLILKGFEEIKIKTGIWAEAKKSNVGLGFLLLGIYFLFSKEF